MVTEPISPTRMEEETIIAGSKVDLLGSLVLEYIDYSAEGEDITAQIGLLDANVRDHPVVLRLIQYANRLREQVVGLQRYNGQLNKTVTSYENQMREFQVSDAGNIEADILPKLKRFMDKRRPSPELVGMPCSRHGHPRGYPPQ